MTRGTESEPDPGTLADEPEDEEELFRRAMQRMRSVPDKDSEPPPASTQTGLRKVRPGLGRRRPIDDQLDLHGRRVHEALPRLRDFVAGAALRRLRVVLVITGKGTNSPSGEAVLKREVERWLFAHGRPYVRAYSEAPRERGGRGALLLYLRT